MPSSVLSSILKTAMQIELSGARVAPSHYEINSLNPKLLEPLSNRHSGELLPCTLPQDIRTKRNAKLGAAAFAFCVISGEDHKADQNAALLGDVNIRSLFSEIFAYPSGLMPRDEKSHLQELDVGQAARLGLLFCTYWFKESAVVGTANSKITKKIWYQAHISQSEASLDEQKVRTVFRRIRES
jgi:hypothetical protein